MSASADIYFEHEPWSGSLVFSVLAHIALFGGTLVWAFFFPSGSGESWGGPDAGGGVMNATLVSSAIPLPRRDFQTESVVATESRGLSQSLPMPEVKPPDAIPIPDVDSKVKPQAESRTPARRQPERRQQAAAQPDNQVPFGQGAPASGQYSTFSAGGTSGGISMGGAFGTRYAWYVDQVRRKVVQNWLQYEIDPNIGAARRVYIQFEITRSGAPRGMQLVQTSGVPSLDTSAMRALQRIDTFGPLPGDYSGSSVMVEMYFEYQR